MHSNIAPTTPASTQTITLDHSPSNLFFQIFFFKKKNPDTIASVGRRGVFASKKLDAQFARSLQTDAVVPQAASDIGTPAPVFDPAFVFTTARPEWVDGNWVQPNPTALLERARGVALLPSRKVITQYYVDFGNAGCHFSLATCNVKVLQQNCRCSRTGTAQNWDMNFGCNCRNYQKPQVPYTTAVSQGIIDENARTIKVLKQNCSCGTGNGNYNHNIHIGCNCRGYQKVTLSFEEAMASGVLTPAKAPESRSVARKHVRDDFVFYPHKTIEFEVDNYLNLYHAASGCYIMCNTTPFPDVAFYGMMYWKPEVFRTRQYTTMSGHFEFTAAEAGFLDTRATFIANLAKLMPDQYEKVFKFADGWRKLPGYQSAMADPGTEGEAEIDGGADDVDLDGADGSTAGLAEKSEERTLLKLTQDRLLVALKRSDAAEATAREIGGIFQTKLVELTEACLELEKERAASAAAADATVVASAAAAAATASAKAAVLEASAAAEAAAKKHSERLEAEIRKSAGHEQEAMAARAALTASENQLALQVATGNSVDTLQADYSKTLRECDKIRALNAALVKELQGERKAGRSGNAEKQTLTAQLLQLQLQGEESKDLAATLKAEIANVTAENAKISGMLAEAASSAGGALEQALTDRISTLEEQLKESTAARTEAEAAQKKSTADYTRLVSQFKSNLSGL